MSRRHRRFKADACACVSAGDEKTRCTLVNVSAGGGFVAVSRPEDIPPVGSGMRLDFRLPIGFWARTNSIVRWVREQASDSGPAGFGVEFTSMQSTNRELLDAYLASAEHGGEGLETTATDKFRVVVDDGVVAICLAGAFDPTESSSLKDELLRQLASATVENVNLFINAAAFQASCTDVLDRLTEMFAEVGRRGLRLGVLIQPPAIAGSQIRRVLRNAGIADAVASFETEVAASEFWSELDDVTDIGSSVSVTSG
jgi:hypothetical protein